MKRPVFSSLASILALGILASHCGRTDSTAKPVLTTAASGTPGAATTDPSAVPGSAPATGTVKPGTASTVTTPAQLAKSEEYFNINVLPLLKGTPCSDCHNAPRNLKDPNVNGGTTILEHPKMLALLKDGKGANDNKLINKLLGVVPHTGGKLCTFETSVPCGAIKEWYKSVFGDGLLKLGSIESINREGIVAGWAGLSDAPTTAFEVKMYLDGEKGVGTALPSAMANLSGYDNALTGDHAFSVRVPAAMIDAKPHKLWAYAVSGGQEVMLGGSPFSYTAYKPKTAAVATAFAQINFNGCNGQCHNFVYENRWAILLGNGTDGAWSATSNGVYDKLSGKLGHGGPALPGGINLNAVQTWWTQETAP